MKLFITHFTLFTPIRLNLLLSHFEERDVHVIINYRIDGIGKFFDDYFFFWCFIVPFQLFQHDFSLRID